MHFETSWGTNQSADPFSAGGRATYLTINEIEESVEDVTVIAGHAGLDGRLILPDVEDLAALSAFSFEQDGSLTEMTLVLPISLLADGATLTIGKDPLSGGV